MAKETSDPSNVPDKLQDQLAKINLNGDGTIGPDQVNLVSVELSGTEYRAVLVSIVLPICFLSIITE